MRILLTGANGQLGYELQRALTGEDVIAANQPDYELTAPQVADMIASTRPNLVIHTAGYTEEDGTIYRARPRESAQRLRPLQAIRRAGGSCSLPGDADH